MKTNKPESLSDERIQETLDTHTTWNGSPEKMWRAITTELNKQPQVIPWWKKRKNWMASAAAAVILLAVLVSNWQGLFQIGPDPTVPLPRNSSEENTIMMFSAEEPARIRMAPQILEMYIDLPAEIAPGETIDTVLELSSLEQNITVTSGRVYLTRIDQQTGEYEPAGELVIQEAQGLSFTAQEIYKLTIPLQAPEMAGVYGLEIEVEAEQGEQTHLFTSQTIMVVEQVSQ